MSVSVRIPTILRTYTGGESEVVGRRGHPGRGARRPGRPLSRASGAVSSTRPGALRRFVNVYVGNDDVRFLDDLATLTPDGTTISVIPAVAGG